MRFELDSLSHRIESQRLTERDDGAREFRAVTGIRQTVNEGLIDLQNVDRKPVQVGKRRVARAEIVARDADSERLQLAQPPQVRFRVVHDGAFGQFDHEIVRLKPGLLQRVRDVLHQIAVLQVPTGDIYGDPQVGTTRHGTAPGAQFTARALQYPAAELDDLTALLGAPLLGSAPTKPRPFCIV